MLYHLGVDLGTTYCAAAVLRDGQPAPEVVTLGASNPVMPSVVLLRADGTVLHGEAAERRAVEEPTRVGREFKRRLGDATPLVLGGTPYGAEALMARLLRAIVALVTEREGQAPSSVTLTHPANYGPYKLEQMREVANSAGLDPAVTRHLAEPQAAALSYAARDRVLPGEVVAVYDFGGGTFDAALVRRDGDGFVLIGRPDGLDRFGGIDIDAAIMAYVDDAVGGRVTSLDADDPEVQAGVARLRDECRTGKEALSSDSDTSITVALPGVQSRVRLTRPELESMLRPRLIETIEALERTVASARLTMADVSRILLVGGSSRIPLVGEMLRDRTHRPIAVDAHPKFAIAIGAAIDGRATAGQASAAPPLDRTVALPVTAAPAPPPLSSPIPSQTVPPASATPPPPPPSSAVAAPMPIDRPFVAAPVPVVPSRRRVWVGAGAAALVIAAVIGVVVTRGDDDASGGAADAPSSASSPDAAGTAAPSAPATDPSVSASTDVASTEVLPSEVPTSAPTVVSVPAPRTLSEVFDMVGYRFTVTEVAVAPPDEFDIDASVEVEMRVENLTAFEPIFPQMLLRIDGFDIVVQPDVVNVPGGSTARVVGTAAMPIADLDSLVRASLVVGDSGSDLAMVPLGAEADPTAVRHASASTDVVLEVPFGPGARYVDGRLTVTRVGIGASAFIDLPAPEGQVWLSIDYAVCVSQLDAFITPVLQLPDGSRIAPEGVNLSTAGTFRGLPVAFTCPDESAAVALWAVEPAAVAGQTLTVLIDDEEDDELPGSFTITPPSLPPSDQVPA